MIFDLSWPVFLIAGVVGVAVFAVIGFALVRFRERPDEEFTPKQVHGNPAMEIGLTVLPAVLLAAITIPTVTCSSTSTPSPRTRSSSTSSGSSGGGSSTTRRSGRRRAPARHGQRDGDPRRPAGPPEHHLARRHPLVLDPEAQRQARCGARPRPHLDMQADEPGEYWGQCTEFCGLSHANMRMRVVALSPDDFDRWVEQQKTNAASPDDEAVEAGRAQFSSLCASCHQVDGLRRRRRRADRIAAADPGVQRRRAEPHPPHEPHHLRGLDFDLLNEECRAEREALAEDDPEAFSAAYLGAPRPSASTGPSWRPGSATRRACSRCTSTPRNSPPPTARTAGMPTLNLTEDQIDQLVAYLQTLNPAEPRTRRETEMAIIEQPPEPLALRGPTTVTPDAASASSAGRSPRPAGSRGSSRSTTRRSASCTAPPRCPSSSSAASRRC